MYSHTKPRTLRPLATDGVRGLPYFFRGMSYQRPKKQRRSACQCCRVSVKSIIFRVYIFGQQINVCRRRGSLGSVLVYISSCF